MRETNAPRLLPLALLLAPASAQLPAPVAPPENPPTAAKELLGKVLFWDEQLSATGTVACGTCHRPSTGFSDPRSFGLSGLEVYPGVDRIRGTADDVLGSPSLPSVFADGTYDWNMGFGVGVQVTSRNSPTVLNAAYLPKLFLDGRATDTFHDPTTGAVVSPHGAALESQAIQPLLSHKEMAFIGRTAPDIGGLMRWMWPLADAENIPPALVAYIADRRYPGLFDEAFGDPEINGVRISQALASYMRTLVTPDLPYDRFAAGDTGALTPEERAGHDLFFGAAGCASCHPAPLFTDNRFHNIGVDHVPGDVGRMAISGDPNDYGRFRSPSLRNVELTAPYFHDGSARTLEDVVDFYARGGDHAPANLAPQIVPLTLTTSEKSALVAFLKRPLTDPRVAAEQPPFDRPRLFSESARVPLTFGSPTAGSAGLAPRLVLVEPPRRGTTMTVGVDGALGGAPALLLASNSFHPAGQPLLGATTYVPTGAGTQVYRAVLGGSGAGNGFASVPIDLGRSGGALAGARIYVQWLIFDPGAVGRLSATEAGLVVTY